MRKLGARPFVLRVMRIAVVALLAWVAFAWLSPRGLGWVVLPVAAVIIGGFAIFGWSRRRAAARASAPTAEDLWSSAVLDGPRRPKAIREVRARLSAATADDEKARLAIILAELLDADGQAEEARKIVDAVDLGPLDAAHSAMVRHGRAVVRLRAGDAAAALEGLVGRPKRSGDDELDARLELLEAAAKVELGKAEEAMDVATRIRREAGDDGDLAAEARVVRAAALDALGRRAEAIGVLRTLDDGVVDALAQLGHPRVKALAVEAVSGGEKEP